MSAGQGQPAEAAEGIRPILRVISGNPSAEEIAAILAVVLAGVGSARTPGVTTVTDRWVDRQRLMPQHWAPGRGAWRASTNPR
ncbi:MAG: acyl-CoA carboxylase subunit epsilon [Actinomycetales bacterium]